MAAEAPPIYVINRAVDAERLAGFAEAAAARGVAFTRIEALDGHDPAAPLFLYRTLVRDAFWAEDRIKPGALACAVSHMTAWRRMLADGAEAALICEDDARLAAGPEALAELTGAAAGADVVFANDRLAAWAAAAGGDDGGGLIGAPALAADMEAAGARPGDDGLAPAPGADAYLVTRVGAERLLALLDRVGVVAGIDWLMLAASLGAPSAALPEAAFLAPRLGAANRLDARIARAPLATAAKGASALRHEVSVPLTAIRDAASVNRPESGFGASARTPEGLPADPISAAFSGGRFYEEPALAMMARWMPRGGVFVDVGAHVGGHTLFMLVHGGAGRAIPFEHNRIAIDAFGAVMAANGLVDRIDDEALGFGLAEETGKRERKGSPRRPFVNRLKRGFDEGVRVRPGDALIRGAEVAMVKIDVNGEEREAIKGLRKTLKRQSPLLVVDMTRPRSRKAEPLIDRLGYREAERAVWDEDGAPREVRLYRRQG